MKASHQAFARARKRLIDAQTTHAAVIDDDTARQQAVVAVEKAADAMRDAEADVQTEFDAAWEANRKAIEDADAGLRDARQIGRAHV